MFSQYIFAVFNNAEEALFILQGRSRKIYSVEIQ